MRARSSSKSSSMRRSISDEEQDMTVASSAEGCGRVLGELLLVLRPSLGVADWKLGCLIEHRYSLGERQRPERREMSPLRRVACCSRVSLEPPWRLLSLTIGNRLSSDDSDSGPLGCWLTPCDAPPGPARPGSPGPPARRCRPWQGGQGRAAANLNCHWRRLDCFRGPAPRALMRAGELGSKGRAGPARAPSIPRGPHAESPAITSGLRPSQTH